jgi:CRISPR system Cascade subunit CasD
MRHLLLRLESPLMAFGGETVDQLGVTRRFPAASMLTGLFANALGWRRTQTLAHQQLQDRLVFAVRIDREPATRWPITDFQTAQLNKKDRGWTTRGAPDKRDGGHKTYEGPHRRWRDYLADMVVTVALRLEPEEDPPDLDRLADALQQPARPLFIGRKPCLPSVRLFQGFQEGETVLAALLAVPLRSRDGQRESIRVLWPAGEGVESVQPSRRYMLTDERNWISGLHGGGRSVCESAVPAALFPAVDSGDAPVEEGKPA